jgi:hypothetical protein
MHARVGRADGVAVLACRSLFSHVDLDARVRRAHPLRPIQEIANAALADLSADFAALYPGPAEQTLRCPTFPTFGR